jgi:indolepyruvate decarboxylase
MFEHITCANTVLRDTDRAGYEIDRVLTAVNHYKQPGYIEIPRDIIDKPIRYDAYTLGTPKEPASDENNLAEALAEVSAWIASSKNPVIWAGVEVARFGLGKQLVKFAEAANIPIATTILGKSVINEKHPLSLGVYCESIASPELKGIIDNCDCLIALGVMMTDVNLGFLPLKFQRKNSIFAAFSTLDVKNHSYQDVNFADFVNGLSKVKLPRKEYTNTITRKEIKFEATKDKTITCSRVFEKINSVLNENTVVIADVGNALFGSLDIAVHDSHNFLSNAFYASMGFSIAGALGVQTAKPHLRPIVIMGDGAFQMTGMEFSTLVKRKLNPIIIVLNNGGYGTERLILDGPYNDLHNWNYEKIPLLMGGIGFLVNTEEELDNAFNQALPLKNQPVIINIKLDPKDQVRSIKKVFRKE